MDKVREIELSVSMGKITKQGTTIPLTGLCYCADCGSKIKQTGSVCGQYVKFGKKYCSSNLIIVFADIERQIDFVDEKFSFTEQSD